MSQTADLLIILNSVDSTNNYAMGLIHSGMATGGSAIMALEQLAGKGRNQKSWIAQKGLNLTISFIEDISYVPVYRHFEISMAAALACTDMYLQLGLEGISIKWPNDIYYSDKKAGGILIENTINGNFFKWSVVGIGLNINQTAFPDNINATSIKKISGENYDVITVAQQLKTFIRYRFDLIKNNSQSSLSEYNNLLFARNKIVRLKKGNILFDSLICGVNQNGELITKDSTERIFKFDEVQWLL